MHMPSGQRSFDKLARSVAVVVAFLLLGATGLATAAPAQHGEVAKGTRDQQIFFWEQEIQSLRRDELSDAVGKLYTAQATLEGAKRKEGFFYTRPEDKATIRHLDENYQRALVEVQTIREQERMMLAKLKPLYGLLSTQFAQEQKTTISECLSVVQEMSYNNAWWSSLFNIGDAESLTDIIVGFLARWLVGHIILYPFAVLYYAVWAAPWSVYAYCSGAGDLIPAVVVYVISVTVMCLPLVALVGGLYVIAKKYGHSIEEALEGARRRDRFHQD